MQKMVSEACVGLKRKRETESNSPEELKTLKISKIDSDKLPVENPCNLNSSQPCIDETIEIDTSSENHCDLENSSNSAIAEITESKSDKNSNGSLQDADDVSDDDDVSSSAVSADLNSSAANDVLDISASSVNGCTDDQPEKNSNNDSSFQNTDKPDVVEGKPTQSDKVKKKKRMSPEEAKLKTEERIQKQKERDLKRQETLAKKEERRLLQEKRKQEKQLALEEKQKKKEAEEQQKKEKKRLEELQKEEKNKMKQLALEAKAEEKKKKEEQKQKALEEKEKEKEEKKKAEEEKKKAEEEKIRIEQEKERKAKEAFVNFFVRSGSSISQTPVQPQRKEIVFRPFQVTEGMVLAPIVPPDARQRFDKQALDQCITRQNTQDCKDLYLSILKSKDYKILKTRRKSKSNLDDDDEVIVLRSENAPELNLKAKLLQFCENMRPAYFGTWRKRSKNIIPRNPFKKDDILDYEVDSDDEWEEGGPGESLTGTEEEESEDDYEVDNEFFVPHGYLSAEEEGEEESKTVDPEELRMRLKMKEKEFLYERKKKTTELKPVVLGCFFDADGTEDMLAVEKSLKVYAAELLSQNNLVSAVFTPSLQSNDVASADSPPKDKTKVLNYKCPVPEEGMPFLIKLLHANINSKQSVIKEFQEFWRKQSQRKVVPEDDVNAKDTIPTTTTVRTYISKRQLDITIQNISSWIKSPDASFKKYCWWVREEIRDKYNCMDTPVPNQWNYVLLRQSSLEPSVKSVSENQEQC